MDDGNITTVEIPMTEDEVPVATILTFFMRKGIVIKVHVNDALSLPQFSLWNCTPTCFVGLTHTLCQALCHFDNESKRHFNACLSKMENGNLQFVFGHNNRVAAVDMASKEETVKDMMKGLFKQLDVEMAGFRIHVKILPPETPGTGKSSQQPRQELPGRSNDTEQKPGNSDGQRTPAMGDVVVKGVDGTGTAKTSNAAGIQNIDTFIQGDFYGGSENAGMADQQGQSKIESKSIQAHGDIQDCTIKVTRSKDETTEEVYVRFHDKNKDEINKSTCETEWKCKPKPDKKVLNAEPCSRMMEVLYSMMNSIQQLCGAKGKEVRSGSIVFVFEHETKKDAIQMIKRYVEVEHLILHCLRQLDPEVEDITLHIKLQDLSQSERKGDPKAFVDDDGVFTVDFIDKESSWTCFTEWTCMLASRECEIPFTRTINEHLCDMRSHFDRPPGVKLVTLHNPEQKIVLVFGHDTEHNAFKMMLKIADVRNTVVSFLHKIHRPMEDIKVRVRLRGTDQSARQQDQGFNCIFDPRPDFPTEETSETTWFCKPDIPNLEVDNERSNTQFTRFKENVRSSFRACLARVSTGPVVFTFYHGSTEDALEMISKHEEVRAMILECLQGIDSTVKDIQMEAQLQDFIDPRSPLGPDDPEKRYVDKQEHDKVVKELSEQVSTLMKQLQETKEKERAQLADIRLSMWNPRPGSPQPSESSGYFTATDTMTDVGDEEFQHTAELLEPEGGLGHSKPQHASGTVTDLRRQLADMGQELKATTERMHRLEITHQKAWSEREALRPGPTQKSDVHAASREGDTGKSGTPTRSRERDTATPTAARKLAEVKRILATGRADVNSRSVGGRTPVMRAAWRKHRDLVEVLVKHGADVSLVDGGGSNILHWACVGGDRKTVEFVLSLAGVDVNTKNNWGQTAADVAREWEHHQLLDFLESRGAAK